MIRKPTARFCFTLEEILSKTSIFLHAMNDSIGVAIAPRKRGLPTWRDVSNAVLRSKIRSPWQQSDAELACDSGFRRDPVGATDVTDYRSSHSAERVRDSPHGGFRGYMYRLFKTGPKHAG